MFDADGDGDNESTGVTDDPSAAGTTNPTSFVVVEGVDILEIPTLDTLGLVLLMIGLSAAAAFVLRKRHSA